MTDPTPITILNVDDNEANRYAITRMLRRAGFASLEAANGEEALRLVAAKPDLVILDVNLPDIDGFEICRRIKADPATAAIPVLHMSASYILSEDRTRALDEGSDGYLIRPVEPPELIATVKALLRVRSAERMARVVARQWSTTFDAIGEAICLLDPSGRLVRSNRAADEILGQGPGALLGSPLREMVADPAAAGDLRIGDRWFRVGVHPILDDEDTTAGVVCILTDITERRRLEDELRRRADDLAEADRRKDEFLAMLAHELRNPLAPILNAFEVMRAETGGEDALAPIRQVGERQVRHLARLVDDLLDVSRISSSKIQLRLQPLDLLDVVDRVIETIRPAIEGRGHSFLVRPCPGPLPMRGDATRLEQILTNLLNNASKYTEPPGRIEISVGVTDDQAVVRVKDSGMGIPPEMLTRVFDLFAQADRALDRSQGGLGIGLTLVRRLVELHGGSVSASSPGLGRGSEFAVCLPLDASAIEAAGDGPKPANSDAPPRARRITVVDDQADAARMLARLLKGRGHDVRVASDGASALETTREHGSDVVLLDIGLPGMDGYEIARRLRARPGGEALLLIALTGYGRDDDLRQAREAGFDHHLVKPTDLESIERLMESSRGAFSKSP
ncbi:response regulator [Tundrisphaera sp. TA3]|uniref:response regulator n=1 Tax=Tundrisphaera sp. TA3 TaxID=3435775 RepID=UPI003EC156AA